MVCGKLGNSTYYEIIMFGNFIYFIIALLIYATYQPAEEPNFSTSETLALFLAAFLIFALFTRIQFYRIEKKLRRYTPLDRDHGFETTLTRHSILAVALFAFNIYGMSLPWFFSDLPVFVFIPTLQALAFIALFICYMAVVWACAYHAQREIHAGGASRSAYVLSNISFAVPVLLPWLMLSGFSDIIHALPFEWPKRLLATTTGEIGYFLFFLLIVTIFGPALIQKFWQCKPLKEGLDRARIENLCLRAGMKYRNIMHWPIFGGAMITAGVMGLVAKFRYILVTDALLRYLTADEIDAVIAHEIGHIKRKHLLFYLFFFIGYMVFSYATFDLMVFFVLYIEPLYGVVSRTGLNQATVISGIFSIMIIAMFLVYFRFIFGYFMRNFERQADAYVYRLFDSARPLISTLEKIAVTSGHPPDKPNWHHFSIIERIDFLKKCEIDRGWIDRHDRKIRKSMGVFLLALAVMAGIGYQLNFGETGRRLNQQFFKTIVERELEKHPNDPRLLATLGDLYYNGGHYPETIHAYEQSLRFDPENPHVMNNLAWLYATCDDASLRDPRRALSLAGAAAELDESPHILDTLAESYYVNGRFEEAVASEREALKRVISGRAYFEKQLKKFMAGRAGEAPGLREKK